MVLGLGVLQGATLADIEVGMEAVCIVGECNEDKMSKMKAIRSAPVLEVKVKTLCAWMTILGLQVKKNFSKHNIIKCLLPAKAHHKRGGNVSSEGAGNGNSREDLSMPRPNSPRALINNARFINVLTKGDVKALSPQHGAWKTRAQLDNGEDLDGPLWALIVDYHNDKDDLDVEDV